MSMNQTKQAFTWLCKEKKDELSLSEEKRQRKMEKSQEQRRGAHVELDLWWGIFSATRARETMTVT